ncbi:MAG: hypothetical protein OSB61_09425 [Verrucomicrobiota bacterium]|nr:hypothetical protein [Verrucomicrobiota bacterium]
MAKRIKAAPTRGGGGGGELRNNPLRLLDDDLLAGQQAKAKYLANLGIADSVAFHRAQSHRQRAVPHFNGVGHLRFLRLDGFDLVGYGSGYFPATTRGSAGGTGSSSAQRTPLSSSR